MAGVGKGLTSAPVAGTVAKAHAKDGWIPIYIADVLRSGGKTLIICSVVPNRRDMGIGILEDVDTAANLPAFIRPQKKRRGIVDLSALSNLEPVSTTGLLDCRTIEDIFTYEKALAGSASHQNLVGWQMSFGRQKAATLADNQFTLPNWLGGKHWIWLAAKGGYPSAFNNLASDQILSRLGLDLDAQAIVRRQLNECALAFKDAVAEKDVDLKNAARCQADDLLDRLRLLPSRPTKKLRRANP